MLKKRKEPFGRPTKYKPEYCEKIVEFFTYIISTNNWPTFEGFAASINVSTETLQDWKNNKPDFSVSYNKALNLQKDNLFMNTLKKNYDSSFARFLASACYGLSEKTQVDQVSSDKSMAPQQITIEIIK